MITRAIVDEILSPYKVRVCIPYYNNPSDAFDATPRDELYIASVCTVPNCEYNFSEGDAVFVAFEDNSPELPVILGQLSRPNKTDVNSSIKCDGLQTNVDAHLPEATTIGDVSSTEIGYLSGTTSNIQFQIEILKQRIAKLNDLINDLENTQST